MSVMALVGLTELMAEGEKVFAADSVEVTVTEEMGESTEDTMPEMWAGPTRTAFVP